MSMTAKLQALEDTAIYTKEGAEYSCITPATKLWIEQTGAIGWWDANSGFKGNLRDHGGVCLANLESMNVPVIMVGLGQTEPLAKSRQMRALFDVSPLSLLEASGEG